MIIINKRVALPLACICAILGAALFVPPIRDRFFTTKLWPWRTPWDVTPQQLTLMSEQAEPGDVVIESNLHGWQWMALCLATTGTSWVHAALVDENRRLITVHKQVIETGWDIYLEWGSTRMALLRPPYASKEQRQSAIDFARSKVGTQYDATFRNHEGNCNGLVATALQQADIEVSPRRCFGRQVYPGDCFLHIPRVLRVC